MKLKRYFPILLAALMCGGFTACDEEPESNKENTENNSGSDDNDYPAVTPTPDPTPDPEPEPEPEPVYATPTEEDLLGHWNVEWRETISYSRYSRDEKFTRKVERYEFGGLYHKEHPSYFLDFISFLKDGMFMWNLTWDSEDKLYAMLEEGRDWYSGSDFSINNGVVTSGYIWSHSAYGDRVIIPLKSRETRKVAHRLTITKYTGDSFEAVRTHDDDIHGFKSDLLNYTEYRYKYIRAVRPE